LIIGFQDTVENVGDVFWDTVYMYTQCDIFPSKIWKRIFPDGPRENDFPNPAVVVYVPVHNICVTDRQTDRQTDDKQHIVSKAWFNGQPKTHCAL